MEIEPDSLTVLQLLPNPVVELPKPPPLPPRPAEDPWAASDIRYLEETSNDNFTLSKYWLTAKEQLTDLLLLSLKVGCHFKQGDLCRERLKGGLQVL